MKRTNIYLDEQQTASLDMLAARRGVSRAELIRQLLDRAINNGDDNLESDLTAIGASFAALSDVESPDRRAGGREAHLDRMWHRTP